MKVILSAQHFDLSDSIKNYVENEKNKLMKYFNVEEGKNDYKNPDKIYVALSLSGKEIKGHKAEAVCEISLYYGNTKFNTKDTERDIYGAIYTAFKKIDSQIRKQIEKTAERHQKKFSYVNMYEKNDKNNVKYISLIVDSFTIIEALEIFIKEEKERPYFMFHNIETDRNNVIVRKNAEQIKIIEPYRTANSINAMVYDKDGKTPIQAKELVAESINVKEAMKIFDDWKENFYVFHNIETDKINIIVKKDENHYKVLEP